jgi:peptidoglycan/LPS O-acetylase OafA/YrhL
MLLGTAAIGLLVLLPGDLADLGREVSAATAFASNVLYWRETDYFGATAGQKLLLHTWSLAVEEQFYVAFRCSCTCCSGRPRLRRVHRHGAGALVRAGRVGRAARAGGDVLPGADARLGAARRRAPGHGRDPGPPARQGMRDGLSLLGLGLIAWGVVAFSSWTPLPGASALVPCLGAALVIHAGAGGRSSLAGRVLSSPPVVFVGLISYSLYLWHWPLLLLAEYYAVRELTGAEAGAVLLLSTLVAAASWRFVERPFRGRRLLAARPRLFATAGLATAATLGLGLALHLTSGMPARLPTEVARLAAAARDHGEKACLHSTRGAVRDGDLCQVGAVGQTRPTLILWGDSHAWALMDAVGEVAAQAGRTGLVASHSLCPPLLGVDVGLLTAPQSCREANASIAELIAARAEVDTVILAARWSHYANGTAYGRGVGTARPPERGRGGPAVDRGERGRVARGLERTIAALVGAGKRS